MPAQTACPLKKKYPIPASARKTRTAGNPFKRPAFISSMDRMTSGPGQVCA
jgi:hypothetical protein